MFGFPPPKCLIRISGCKMFCFTDLLEIRFHPQNVWHEYHVHNVHVHHVHVHHVQYCPCPILSMSTVGPTVTIITSHGAVARSAAAETHTWDFPAWNLRSTFNLPSFTTSTVNYLGAVRSTARHLSYFSSTSTINCFAVYIRSVLELYFSPWKEILLDPLASAIVWVEIWVNLQPNYRQTFQSLSLCH